MFLRQKLISDRGSASMLFSPSVCEGEPIERKSSQRERGYISLF